VFSAFSLACVFYAATALGQLRHSIYLPGLATILLLAYITKKSQTAAMEAMLAAERARERAEAANRELEAFSYSVAHDLRAPLRSIDGFGHALLEDCGGALDDTGRSYLGRIHDSVVNMGKLIDGLLELARLTRTDVRPHRVDLGELARSSVKRLRELDPHRTVDLVIDGGLVEEGDPTLLGAAIDNLMGNAWKFTRNRADARIEFGSEESDGKTVYFVRDNGAGFDMAFAPKLFGVFQRLHARSEFEGTGIGLATVQRIVERHGGRVWAEAKIGEGACFHFTLRARGGSDHGGGSSSRGASNEAVQRRV
jgi:light-regulated signal transduction histidine kinase (bacteriophytochrome)